MAGLNLFQFCKCLKLLGHVMVLFVVGIVGVSWYAMAVASYGPKVAAAGESAGRSLAILVVFHGLLVMLLWSYFQTLRTDPGIVPPGWRPPDFDEEAALSPPTGPGGAWPGSDGAGAVGGGGGVGGGPDEGDNRARPRFCKKCKEFKPDRAHHCSVCGRCVLKMDHHCVWVVNCVGSANYKFFLLFLLYTLLETIFTACALGPEFFDVFDLKKTDEDASGAAAMFLAFVLNAAFSLSLAGFIIMHAGLVLKNATTIEMYEKRRTVPWKYDHGFRRNLQAVFGRRPALWLLPIHHPEDLRLLLNPCEPDVSSQN